VNQRYARFRAVDGFQEAQEQLEKSTVAVVGLGATGSVMAEDLARRGVSLILVDRDYLEEKDLYTSSIYTHRQCENSIPKAKAAEEKLSGLTQVEAHVTDLAPGNIDILEEADIVLDGTDNIDTRLMISEYCRKKGKPWVYTSAIAGKGYSMFLREKCFNCIFEEVEAGQLETCETAGVMREVSSQAAMMSALKAVKYLAGGMPEEKLETVSGESFEISHPGCEVCGGGEYPHLEESKTVSPVCGENRYRAGDSGSMERLERVGNVKASNDYLVRAEYDGREIVVFSSGRTVVEAEDRDHASAIYTELMGV
jgi:adenylyltransferase/sulfurtransferase